MNFDLDHLLGREVEDTRGERLGEVKNLYLDDTTGQPSFITVSVPAGRLVAVPAHELTEGAGTLRVPYERDFVEGAPSVAEEHISEEEQDSIYAYYRYAGRPLPVSDSSAEPQLHAPSGLESDRRDDLGREDAALREGEEIVLHEERAVVETEQREVGSAKLRKHVVTEQQTVTVPVTREELVVEREPLPDGEVRGDHRIGEDAGEQVITLHEDRPVVTKETVATERVTLGVEKHTETVAVPVETAREEVTVEQEDAPGQALEGDHRPQDGQGGLGEKLRGMLHNG